METVTLVLAVTAVIGWIGEILEIFMQPPTIYFIAIALTGAIAGISRKFVPMKRR